MTGATGMLGRQVVARALAKGWDVVAASRGGAAVGAAPGLCLDLCDPASIAALGGRPFDIVFHFGGPSITVGTPALDLLEVFAVGTRRLIEAVAPARPRLLLAASAAQYGHFPAEHNPIAESHPQHPVSAYGMAKAAQELVALHEAYSGRLHVVVGRVFNMVGPGSAAGLALADWAAQVARGELAGGGAIEVGNLESRRDFVDVRDVAEAMLVLAEGGESGTAYNICSGSSVAMAAALDLLLARARRPIAVRQRDSRRRPLDLPDIFGDTSRLAAFGWHATIRLADSVEAMLAEARTRSEPVVAE